MTKTNEAKTIEINDKKYNLDDLSDTARVLIAHVQSLDTKIGQARFNLDQLQGGKNYFMAELKKELPEDK